ncbi:hypothetical protein Agub_g1667, partial [Astrephomene gubernaculifera]
MTRRRCPEPGSLRTPASGPDRGDNNHANSNRGGFPQDRLPALIRIYLRGLPAAAELLLLVRSNDHDVSAVGAYDLVMALIWDVHHLLLPAASPGADMFSSRDPHAFLAATTAAAAIVAD